MGVTVEELDQRASVRAGARTEQSQFRSRARPGDVIRSPGGFRVALSGKCVWEYGLHWVDNHRQEKIGCLFSGCSQWKEVI